MRINKRNIRRMGFLLTDVYELLQKPFVYSVFCYSNLILYAVLSIRSSLIRADPGLSLCLNFPKGGGLLALQATQNVASSVILYIRTAVSVICLIKKKK